MHSTGVAHQISGEDDARQGILQSVNDLIDEVRAVLERGDGS
jgi:hypothetical protein